jgi:hypothetical protein
MAIASTGINSFNAAGLPSVYIENITLLPRDWEANEQEIKVELSLQTTSPIQNRVATAKARRLFDGNYRIFVAFSSNPEPLIKMTQLDSIAKDLIRDPHKEIKGGILRRYIEPPRREARTISAPVNPKAAEDSILAHKKALIFTHKFLLDDLEDIYMYVTTYATDLQTLNKTGVNRKIKAMKISPPATETVMTEGKTALQSAIFVLEETDSEIGEAGKVWPGTVQYDDEVGFVATSEEGAKKIPVRAKMVSNQKIKDYRFLEALRGLSFSNTPSSAQTLTPRQRKDLEKAALVIKKPGTVSDCSYSRTTNNELKISFAIDYARLVRENTKLGFLIKNEDALMSCFKIENIQLWRTRINANIQPNILTPGKITICGSNRKLDPTTSEKLIGTLKNNLVRPVQIRSLNKEVLSVVATDQDIANHNVGTYEYKVIVEMVDMTTSAINYTIERLTKYLTEYNKFLAAADSMGAKSFNIEARLKRNKTELLSLNQQWKRLINSFMSSVEFIFGRTAFPEFNSITWRKNLITMANPANGDLKSMMMLSEIIKNFLSNLRMVSRPAPSAASAGSSKATSKIQSSNKSRRKITIEHVFSSNYTRNSSPGEGTDYLDDTATLNDPLNYTSIGFDDFVSRIDGELQKFKVPRPNAPGINKFGFLSPKRINANGSIVETAAVDLPQELGNGILNSSLKATRIRGPIPSNDSEKIYDAEVDGILGFADVQIVSNTIPLNKIAETPNFGKEKKKSFALRSSNYLGLKDAFNKDTSDHKTALSGSQEQKFKSKRSPKQQIKKAPIINHMSQMAAVGFKPPPKYMPNPQSTSLAAAAAKQKPSTLDDNSTFGRSVNFNSLVEIQYFDGYSTSNGMINLNEPIWRTLTQQEFENMLDSDAKVLCRTVLLNRAMRMPNKYKLPEYDNLFILGNSSPGAARLNYGHSDYEDVFKSMWRKFKSEMKLDSLNIEDYAGKVDTSYAKVPLEVSMGARVKRGAKIGKAPASSRSPAGRRRRGRKGPTRGRGGSY